MQHLIFKIFVDFLAKDILDTLESNDVAIRQYQISNHHSNEEILLRIFQMYLITEHREDPAVIFVGDINIFITLLEQVSLTFFISKYYNSPILVKFTFYSYYSHLFFFINFFLFDCNAIN